MALPQTLSDWQTHVSIVFWSIDGVKDAALRPHCVAASPSLTPPIDPPFAVAVRLGLWCRQVGPQGPSKRLT
jgi:hypothetical protein